MMSQGALHPAVQQPSELILIHPVKLTPKEKDLLIWSALGKSSWEIAQIVGLSESGVNFHFCNIRRKFGVTSRHIALLMALLQGSISLNALSHPLESILAAHHDEEGLC
ncbi:Transcriptional activator protein LasR [compost metagenome]